MGQLGLPVIVSIVSTRRDGMSHALALLYHSRKDALEASAILEP